MDVGGSYQVQNWLTHCQNAFQISYKVKKVDKSGNAFLNLIKRKIDAKKVKIGFWVKQCMYALFECPEDVNEITKYHT